MAGTPTIDRLRPYWHTRMHFNKGVILEEVYNSTINLHSSSYLSKAGEYINNGTNVSTVAIPDFTAGAPINVFMRVFLTERDGATSATLCHKINTPTQEGFNFRIDSLNRLFAIQYCTDSSFVQSTAGSAIRFGRWYVVSFQAQSDSAIGIQAFINGVSAGAAGNTTGKTIRHRGSGIPMRLLGYASGQNLRGIVSDVVVLQNVILTTKDHISISAELNSLSYPTSVYEIRPPDYPTIKDGTPSFAICCGNTTDQANGVTPTTTTAVESKKDTQMASYLQFTRASSSKIDYGVQTQNQLNYEFEWDGDVYFDTASVGQVTEIVKVGDGTTGVCWGLRKTATEKFQFIYGNESTVDFAYSVPSLGPLHIVLRREWVSGTTYDVKLWVNGSYKEKVTGTYAGTGNASARTYIGYSGNVSNTNYLSGRIYYSNIYPHLRPVEKFQRDPFSKTLMLGWGVRANNTVNTVARDTDNVVTVVSGGATFKVNSGFGQTGELQKYLQTTAAGATFYIRGITNANGLTIFYRTTGDLAWTQGAGASGVTVAADGLFTMPATTELLWSELGGQNGIIKENQ